MLPKFLVTLAVAAVALAAPSSSPAKLITKCTVPNTVALTFDDGPYRWGKNVADALDKYGAKGTFFYNGNNWDCIYDMVDTVQYVYSKGHQIGSHTWSHPDLTTLSVADITAQMESVDLALQRILGIVPAFTRPPYGNYNADVLNVAKSRGQNVVTWDFDSGDTVNVSVADQEARYDAVVKQHPSTLLSLEHETKETSALQVAEYAIQKLHGAGYKLVTVAECVGQKPYLKVGKPQQRTSAWHC